MIPVEGHKHLFRDENTGAIINEDDSGYNNYVKLKNQDWDTFNKHLSSWERETTLDC